MSDTRDRLEALLRERILVLDGAWGDDASRTRGLEPEDYRGERFADHPRDVAGDPDLLNLTRPDVVLDIHRPLPRRRRATSRRRTRSRRPRSGRPTTGSRTPCTR